MSGFEKKYGIEETEDVKAFHRSRRMFAIHHNMLYIADANAEYSHAEWFKRMSWIDESDDSLMERIVRGYVKNQKVFFYIGYDFRVDDVAVKAMRNHIRELQGKLGLRDDTEVMAGVIIRSDGTSTERLQFGTVQEFIASAYLY